jgi:hypothetical protein
VQQLLGHPDQLPDVLSARLVRQLLLQQPRQRVGLDPQRLLLLLLLCVRGQQVQQLRVGSLELPVVLSVQLGVPLQRPRLGQRRSFRVQLRLLVKLRRYVLHRVLRHSHQLPNVQHPRGRVHQRE